MDCTNQILLEYVTPSNTIELYHLDKDMILIIENTEGLCFKVYDSLSSFKKNECIKEFISEKELDDYISRR